MSILATIKKNFTPANIEVRQTLSAFLKENNLEAAILDEKDGKRRSLRLFDINGNTVGYITASTNVSEMINAKCSVRKLMSCELGTLDNGAVMLMSPATASIARNETVITKMNFDDLVG